MNSSNRPSAGSHFNIILRFYCNPAIFLLLITLSFPLYAQNYPFQEYTVFDGLPQTQARVLYQDRRGFIWIITRSGISRFDGVEFKNYYRKDGLPTNIISRIFEDNSGYLWALSDSGLSKYDGYSFRHFPYRERLLDEGFSSGCPIEDIILLVLRNPISNQSRLVYFKDGKYFEYQTNNDILDTLKLEIVAFDEKSEYLIFLDKYMNVWKWRDKELTPVTDIKIINIRNDRGEILLERQDGNGPLLEFQDGRIVPYQLINNSGRTEITTIKSKQGEYFQLFRDGVLTNIRSFYHSSTLVDSESNIWIGSEVNMYRLVSTAIYSYSEEDGLPKNTWAIAEDRKGHIWFGSLTGDLIEFDGEKFIQRNDYKVFFNDSPAFFKGSTKTSDGKIYFSLNKGVLIWDGLKFSRLKGIPDDTQICIIYEDPVDKSILFGTGSGLFQLKEGVMRFFPEFVPGKYGVIEGILRDDDGTYLLSGQKGLVRFDGRNAIPVKDPLMPGGYTFTLVKDSYGGIWITSEEGLLFLGKSSSGLRYGLPEEINTTANSIIVMDSSKILVGRMTDICIIDVDRFYHNDPDYFKILDKTCGFTGSECLDNGIIRDRDGKYWILTSGKVFVFDPKKLSINKYPPKVMVTDIEYESDSLTWISLRIPDLFYNTPEKIKINHNQNNLRFRYTGISTTNPSKVLYQYRLTGYEELWSAKSPVREAVYSKLKPGDYEFQVKAFNSDGIETPEVYSIKLKIIPAFWQTMPFKAFVILSAVLSLVFITTWLTRRNINRRNEETRLRNELFRLQMNSVVRQFDPHFTFNAISSVGSLIMKGEKETAYDYILKFSSLLRTMLSDGSLIVRPLSEEIDFVRRYCELQQLRFRERLKWEFRISEDIDLQRPVPKMTIQTFVENSIKHGFGNRIEGGAIDISICNVKGSLEITVADNGIGRKAAQLTGVKGSGTGIKTISKIFDFTNGFNELKAKIEITDIDDGRNGIAGTKVKIVIPDGYRYE